MLKIINFLIFAVFGYGAYYSYINYATNESLINPLLLDVLALVYVMIIKRKDTNIVTLAFIGLLFKPINMAVMSGASCMSGFAYYPLMAMLNGLVLVTIWMRPVIFSHFGPFKNRKGWTVTNADDGLSFILILMIVFNLLLLVEQAIRRFGLNITWLYNSYEYVQLGFMLASIAILWFCTTDKAATQSQFRNKPEKELS
jgi:hypothetical protein